MKRKVATRSASSSPSTAKSLKKKSSRSSVSPAPSPRTEKILALPEEPSTPLGQLAVCFLGINVFYLIYGWLQEDISRYKSPKDAKKLDNTLLLFFAQSVCNALLALAARLVVPQAARAKPLDSTARTSPLQSRFQMNGYVWLGLISFSYLMAMLSSHEALAYVSYPAQALAKSCKMLPVMLGNMLVGVRYSWREYFMVSVVTLGITVFQMPEFSMSLPTSDVFTPGAYIGGGLLLLSLALDGVTGSNQHLFDREYKVSSYDLMLGMNLFSSAMIFVALLVTGSGVSGVTYVWENPEMASKILAFGLCSAAGQSFIFYTITGPGPLACTTITTTRKFFSIVLSVVARPENKLTSRQWSGVALVFLGLGLELAAKFKDRHSKKGASTKEPHAKPH